MISFLLSALHMLLSFLLTLAIVIGIIALPFLVMIAGIFLDASADRRDGVTRWRDVRGHEHVYRKGSGHIY